MDERILITGANRGIGLALAREMVGRHWLVFATCRRSSDASVLNQLHASSPTRLQILRMDIVDEASIRKAVEAVSAERKTLDVLVNNAAIFPESGDEPIEKLDLSLMEDAFRTNVVGTARVTRAFLPLLRKGKDPRIVNVGSGAGSITEKDNGRNYCYGASKAALNMFTRTLSHEQPTITVVSISPGWVRTDMGGAHAELSAEESAASMARTIVGLRLEQSGKFLDRDGNDGVYKW